MVQCLVLRPPRSVTVNWGIVLNRSIGRLLLFEKPTTILYSRKYHAKRMRVCSLTNGGVIQSELMTSSTNCYQAGNFAQRRTISRPLKGDNEESF